MKNPGTQRLHTSPPDPKARGDRIRGFSITMNQGASSAQKGWIPCTQMIPKPSCFSLIHLQVYKGLNVGSAKTAVHEREVCCTVIHPIPIDRHSFGKRRVSGYQILYKIIS